VAATSPAAARIASAAHVTTHVTTRLTKDAADIAGLTREYLMPAVIGSYGPAVKRANDLQSHHKALLINYIVPQA
jgi:hypothetical protein